MGRFTSGEEDFSNVKTLMGTERFEVDFFFVKLWFLTFSENHVPPVNLKPMGPPRIFEHVTMIENRFPPPILTHSSPPYFWTKLFADFAQPKRIPQWSPIWQIWNNTKLRQWTRDFQPSWNVLKIRYVILQAKIKTPSTHRFGSTSLLWAVQRFEVAISGGRQNPRPPREFETDASPPYFWLNIWRRLTVPPVNFKKMVDEQLTTND